MNIEIKKLSRKSNIEPICSCCSDEILQDFQKNFNVKDLNIGDYVKQKFKGEDEHGEIRVEHMWIRITHIGTEIEGILESKPIWLLEPKIGDKIYITPSELSSHTKGPS